MDAIYINNLIKNKNSNKMFTFFWMNGRFFRRMVKEDFQMFVFCHSKIGYLNS